MFKKLFTFFLAMAVLIGMTSVGFAETDPFEMEPWKEYDFEGETITIQLHNPGMTPFAARDEDSWVDPSPELKDHIQSVEDKFNANLEFLELPEEDSREYMLTEIMTGDPKFDIANWAGSELIEEGAAFPLSSVIDFEEFTEKRLPKPLRNRFYHADGEIYNMVWYPEPSLPPFRVLVFDKELFEEENLTSPYDLYLEDEWTWDAFEKIAYEATRDTNGDGEIDQFGAAAYGGMYTWSMTALRTYLLPSNDAGFTKIDEDGNRVVGFDQPEFIEAIEFWKQFAEDNIIPGDGGHPDGPWNDPEPANVAMMFTGAHWLEPEENPHVGFVPLPKGPHAEDYQLLGDNWRIGGGFSPYLPITADNPKALFELSHALFKSAAPYMEWSFEEFEEKLKESVFEYAVDEKHAKVLEDYSEDLKTPTDVYFKTPSDNDIRVEIQDYIYEAFEGEKSPSAAMAEARPIAEAMLED